MTAVDDLPRVADLTDLELVELTQAGSREAVGELWLRHYPSTLRTASGVTRQAWDAEEVTSEAFTAMMSALQNGHGPTTSVRAYLNTSVRNLAAKRATGPRSAEVPSEDPTRYEDTDRLDPDAVARNAELGLVREAFSSLPDRWQTVLWRTAVDQDSHDRVAEAMGLSRNAVAALAVRARRALKVAYLRAHVSRGAVDAGCQPFLDQLAGLSQGARATSRLQTHLDACERCRDRVSELVLVEQNVAGFLLPAVAVLVPTLSGLSAVGGLTTLGAAGHAAMSAPAASGAVGSVGSAPAASAPATGAATPPTPMVAGRAELLGPARRARQIRQASVAAGAAVVLAAVAFALTRPDPAPSAPESAAPAPQTTPTPTLSTAPVAPAPNSPAGAASPATPLPASAVASPNVPPANAPQQTSNPATSVVPAPSKVYAPTTLGLVFQSGANTLAIMPTLSIGSATNALQLSVSLPTGVTLTGSSGAWTGCTQSGTTVACSSSPQAAGTVTGAVNTTWPASSAGTVVVTVSGTTTSGAAVNVSLGAPWPLQ